MKLPKVIDEFPKVIIGLKNLSSTNDSDANMVANLEILSDKIKKAISENKINYD